MTIEPTKSRMGKASIKQSLFYLLKCLLALSLFLPSSLYGKTVLKVGVYNNKPTIFVNENGVVQGLFVDILDDIASQEKWEIEYVIGHFSEVYDSLKAGTIDLLPAVAFSKEREALLDFTNETVIANWGEIYTSANLKVTSLVELEGKKIAVKQGDLHFYFLKRMTENFNISCRFIEADEYETVFEMLNANYVDIGVVNRLYGNEMKGQYNVQDTPIIFNPIEMRYAASERKNDEVLNKIDLYLTAAKNDQNSVYYQAINRWLVIDTEKKLPRWFWQLFGVGTGSGLFLLSAMLLFRSQVKKRTKELSETNKQLNAQIEERAKTEAELRKFARIVEASPDAMALVDKEHRHILANRVYREMFSTTERDVEGASMQDFLGSDFFDKELKESVLGCLNGRVVNIQTMAWRGQENNSYWHITLSPYYLNNDAIGGYVIDIRDVTGQVEIQNRLENAQKMEAIGLLAGGVAHDLNNILSGIVSYPDMLLVDRSPDDPMTKPLQTIKKSGERAAAIVQDLLTLARRGIGSEVILNLNDIIKDFLSSPEHDDLVTNVCEIKFQLQLDVNLLNISGSPVHLSKILMNLFCNGIEAMPQGGTLTILSENRFLDKEYVGYECIPVGEYAVISVDDTGIGIPSSEIKKIFDPFYTNKIMGRSGTGLGMAIVWGAIKDHKGFIDINSAPGTGTRFTLYFPSSREIIPEKEEAVLQNFMGSGQSLLVVDDMEEQRILASQILELLGYQVDIASSGDEAVEKCQKNEFDLIILDMIMPDGMDGFETYKKISAINFGQRAIIASGFSDSSSVRQTQAYGAGMYLKKPYTVESLAQAVCHELANDR
jgi:two-component system cell cycle sensor histidine kinase/response regulator CckA